MHHIYTTLTRNISCDKAVSAASQSLGWIGNTSSMSYPAQLLYRCSIYSLLTRNISCDKPQSAVSQSLVRMECTPSTIHPNQFLSETTSHDFWQEIRVCSPVGCCLRSLNHWLEWNVHQVLSIRTNFFPRPHLTPSDKKLGCAAQDGGVYGN